MVIWVYKVIIAAETLSTEHNMQKRNREKSHTSPYLLMMDVETLQVMSYIFILLYIHLLSEDEDMQVKQMEVGVGQRWKGTR